MVEWRFWDSAASSMESPLQRGRETGARKEGAYLGLGLVVNLRESWQRLVMFITTVYPSCTSPQEREGAGGDTEAPGLAWPGLSTHHEACSVCLLLFWLGSLHEPTHRSNTSVHRVFYPEARGPPFLRLAFAPHVSLIDVCLWVESPGVVVCFVLLGGHEERLGLSTVLQCAGFCHAVQSSRGLALGAIKRNTRGKEGRGGEST